MAASIKEMIEFEKGSPSEDNYNQIFEKDLPSDKKKKIVGREVVDDMVNHPPHYNQYGIECIDAIKACTGKGFEAYLQGNILKYLWRYDYKNGVEDLKKAKWYLSELIEIRNDNKS